MGGDFAHFFFSTEVDGEGSGVLVQEGGEPFLVFFGFIPAEASFDGNGEIGGFSGILIAFCGEIGILNHGGAATGFIDVFVGTAEV